MVKEHELILMGTSMLGNGRMGDGMVKKLGLKVTESSMKVSSRTDGCMVKEHELFLMVKSMKGNGSMIENTVKEHELFLMETSM